MMSKCILFTSPLKVGLGDIDHLAAQIAKAFGATGIAGAVDGTAPGARQTLGAALSALSVRAAAWQLFRAGSFFLSPDAVRQRTGHLADA